ncbi:hypothetical protein Egran_02428 [Elaphomyces granulatus]|uniref:TRIP4/RQT4 C2HC5-type zinc finger domain-containing protein n=1 Tax=Elaphomyces granulatus TaxID=519963 RepID=A0A232M076_9EURO|nr:hypothetical protein Egran_02428 [Elaphomyces granulatus]
MSIDLVSWSRPRLSSLLPLDEESLTQIITYSAGLSKIEAAEYLKNLLGDSPAALEFITSFNVRRGDVTLSAAEHSGRSSPATDKDGASTKQDQERNSRTKIRRIKAPLHNAGPPRRPENYGNVAGGYLKADKEEDYMAAMSSRGSHKPEPSKIFPHNAANPDVPAPSNESKALHKPQHSNTTSSPSSSSATPRNQSPASKSGGKIPPSAAGPLISDYLPNVKARAARPARNAVTSNSNQSITTGNIADLTAAIAALEVSTNPISTKNRQRCNCSASIHPLFTPAPNCLNCGKIICSLEGLQPCSFCGSPLLSSTEVQSMIKELRAERGVEKMRAHNDSLQHKSLGQPSSSAGKLEAAVAHRDKLLAFQSQNSQRTRIVDEAADFETPNAASTQWMNLSQRALALKRQQQVLREMEEKARPEWEKKSTVMSLDIKGGRVIRTYLSAPNTSTVKEDKPEEDIHQDLAGDDRDVSNSGSAAFSKNPFLSSGGLVRPVWKAADGKEGRRAMPTKGQTWRRVRDDNDDNEQWILDGGMHGFDNSAT